MSVEISEQHWASAPTWINCRWRGVSLLHVAWAALTTGGTMILQSYLIYFYGDVQLAMWYRHCVGLQTESLMQVYGA